MSSATPVPIALASATLPARTAPISPATPSIDVRPEGERIEELVVDPAVDDIDLLPPGVVRRKTRLSSDEEITALDELDPHLLREKRVLEVGRVVDAGCQQDDARAARGARTARRGERPVGCPGADRE